MFEPPSLLSEQRSYRVAVVQWAEPDGVAQDICEALRDLGHTAVPILHTARIPADCDVVLTFAPWGRFLPLAGSVGKMPAANRPTLLHWNLENPPDISIPWPALKRMAVFRSWVSSLHDTSRQRSGPRPGRNESAALFRHAYGQVPLLR